ncbi:2-hydroxyacyl-CoA lyase isoform X1 [Selaginella moellendorffii]|nr:2-hydroxyacyl-CoA lyase isoform X1 [Selaginella moellendorffii]|eukprot:XP_024541758.1 2-hydroxyacyl-CoA lyase isoform X1 [Selaginella moellendorffii]
MMWDRLSWRTRMNWVKWSFSSRYRRSSVALGKVDFLLTGSLSSPVTSLWSRVLEGASIPGSSAMDSGVAEGAGKVYIDGNMLAVKALAAAGVETMYGVVGIPVTSLATYAMKVGIKFIAFRNEQSAGYAASAAGFLTGKPGVLLTVSGPGCVHGLAGLSNAMINTWPLVMISGSCTQKDIGKGDFQELDQMEAVKPFVKYSGKASQISEVPEVVSKAFQVALEDQPGGTYIDLPSDVLHENISVEEAEKLLAGVKAAKPMFSRELECHCSESDIQEALSLLHKAEKPLVVFGKGAALSRAEGAIKQFVERSGIPFLATPMGKGVISDTHHLSAGAARSLALRESDVALVIGARLNWLLHFGEPPQWSDSVKFILVNTSKEEMELRRPAVKLVGDARMVMTDLNKQWKDSPFSLGDKHPWVEKLKNKASDSVEKMAARLKQDVVPFNFLTPLRIIRDAISSLGSPTPILVSEGANTMDIGRTVFQQLEPRTRLDAGTWGTMGIGMGYAIAAAVESPGRLVVAVEGDSGFGFSGFELETIVRYNLPIVVIIFNNDGVYGGDRRTPEDKEGPLKDFPAPTSFIPCARYDKVMEAFGGSGYFVKEPKELESAVNEAFASKKPALINVRIDPFAGSESGRMHHKN